MAPLQAHQLAISTSIAQILPPFSELPVKVQAYFWDITFAMKATLTKEGKFSAPITCLSIGRLAITARSS